jgi:hypothetical protein
MHARSACGPSPRYNMHTDVAHAGDDGCTMTVQLIHVLNYDCWRQQHPILVGHAAECQLACQAGRR